MSVSRSLTSRILILAGLTAGGACLGAYLVEYVGGPRFVSWEPLHFAAGLWGGSAVLCPYTPEPIYGSWTYADYLKEDFGRPRVSLLLPRSIVLPDVSDAGGKARSALLVPLRPLAVLALGMSAIVYLWTRHRPAGCCTKCGYNLTGNVSGRCPECGQPVGTSLHRTVPGRHQFACERRGVAES